MVPDREQLEAMAGRLGISDRVQFYGNLLPADINPLRLRASVAVLPSRWPETFAMAGPEAMMIGLPVVAYDSGAVSEWLEDGVSGQLVPVGDKKALASALENLLLNPPASVRMGSAARLSANRWSIDRHVKTLAEIYNNCVGRPN